jgi:hypothetical protein
MLESKIIILPRSMPVGERITEVGEQLSEWLNSFGELTKAAWNTLRLTKVEKTKKEYNYYYSISTGEELSASNAKVQRRPSHPLEISESAGTLPQTEKPKTGLSHSQALQKE